MVRNVRRRGLQDNMPTLTSQTQIISAKHYKVLLLGCVTQSFLFVSILFSHCVLLLKPAKVYTYLLISWFRLVSRCFSNFDRSCSLLCRFGWNPTNSSATTWWYVIRKTFCRIVLRSSLPISWIFNFSLLFFWQSFSNLWMKSKMRI